MKHKLSIYSLIFIAIFFSCANDQPLAPEAIKGKIVGIVKPFGIKAQVKLIQGTAIDSVTADSASGYFIIRNVTPGVYNLDFSALNYGRQALSNIIVYEGKTTATPNVTLKPFPEQLGSIFPADYTQDFPVNSTVTIGFTELMNHSSVQSNLTISPTVAGKYEWEIRPSGSVLHFTPEIEFASNTSYLIQLSRQAKTFSADTLAFDVVSHFHTEGFKLVSTTPPDQATYISPQTEIFLVFNTMVDRQTFDDAFSVEPLTLGNFRWYDAWRVSFQPGYYLASDTEYRIYNLENVADLYGTPLSGKSEFTFRTEPLRVTSYYPLNGATQISRTTSIVVTFNTAVDQAATENSFSIVPRPSNWSFKWNDVTQLVYQGTSPLDANTLYAVTIQDTLCADQWQNPLPRDFTFLFKTGN
ncbi:MAG: hypothetical protein GXO74_00975 [Calditrichaeota bacterium]|nr:hypothetical protein [Calditrichota bacterium]